MGVVALTRRSTLRNEFSKLRDSCHMISALAAVLTVNPVERFSLVVNFGGGVTFLRGFRQQYEEKAGVRYGVWFAPLRLWGTRAEDPFRGLRAGPVRSSPHFFVQTIWKRISLPHQNPATSFSF